MAPENIVTHSAATGGVVATLLGLLPTVLGVVATALAALWYSIQLYESDTVQKWLSRRRAMYKSRRLARLKAEQKILVAEIDAIEVLREAKAVATEKVEVAKHEATRQAANDAHQDFNA